MRKGRVFVSGEATPGGTAAGIGSALRDAFAIDDGDDAEVRRMNRLIEQLKMIEQRPVACK